MKINTEPSRMSKRQKRYYNAGYEAGRSAALEATVAIQARNERWNQDHKDAMLGNRDRSIHSLNGQVAELKRELQFARDRIEQLTNSVVIIRESKK